MSDAPPSATSPQLNRSNSQSPYFVQVVSTIIHNKEIGSFSDDLRSFEELMRKLKKATSGSRDSLRKNEARREKALADLDKSGLARSCDTVDTHPLTLLVIQLSARKRSLFVDVRNSSSTCQKQRPYSTH